MLEAGARVKGGHLTRPVSAGASSSQSVKAPLFSSLQSCLQLWSCSWAAYRAGSSLHSPQSCSTQCPAVLAVSELQLCTASSARPSLISGLDLSPAPKSNQCSLSFGINALSHKASRAMSCKVSPVPLLSPSPSSTPPSAALRTSSLFVQQRFYPLVKRRHMLLLRQGSPAMQSIKK